MVICAYGANSELVSGRFDGVKLIKDGARGVLEGGGVVCQYA